MPFLKKSQLIQNGLQFPSLSLKFQYPKIRRIFMQSTNPESAVAFMLCSGLVLTYLDLRQSID